jgi:hypothetical protein
MKLDFCLIYKMEDLPVKPETLKLLGKNMGRKFLAISLGNG